MMECPYDVGKISFCPVKKKGSIRQGLKWTKEEEEIAWKLHKEGKTYREIAQALRRTRDGIKKKITKLKKKFEHN